MSEELATLLAGLIQGLLEWLPVSSEGQVSIFLSLVCGRAPASAVSTALWLHLGTALSAVAYLRGDVSSALEAAFRREKGDWWTLRYLIVGTLATALTGVPAYYLTVGLPSTTALVLLVPALLTLLGLFLLAAERRSRGPGSRRSGDPVRLGGLVGLLQGVAAIPGVSRSGITVLALILLGLDVGEALRLSFLLAIPASVGAAALTAASGSTGFGTAQLLSAAAAAASGYASMHALMGLSRRVSPGAFALAFGLMGLALGLAIVL